MLSDVGHVVVVDDDPSLRQMVIRYLEDHNMPAKSASNRIELNRHFAGTSPSLIILDLRLGQDDGLDLLREIRSHSDVPVIIMTGHRLTRSIASSVSSSVRTTRKTIQPQRVACPRSRRIAAAGNGTGCT